MSYALHGIAAQLRQLPNNDGVPPNKALELTAVPASGNVAVFHASRAIAGRATVGVGSSAWTLAGFSNSYSLSICMSSTNVLHSFETLL